MPVCEDASCALSAALDQVTRETGTQKTTTIYQNDLKFRDGLNSIFIASKYHKKLFQE